MLLVDIFCPKLFVRRYSLSADEFRIQTFLPQQKHFEQSVLPRLLAGKKLQLYKQKLLKTL
jgi:hypothetical protein